MSFILSCLTDSPSARRVLRATSLCVKALQHHVRMVHVGAIDDAGRRRLNDLIAEEVGPGHQLEVIEPTDRVGDAIVQLAQNLEATLVIMGALQREKAVRDLVGSTARLVARRAPCSVMLVSTIGADPPAWSRFIVGVEGGTSGRELATAMLAMARCAGSPAEICFALEYRGVGRHAPPPTEFQNPIDHGEFPTDEPAELTALMSRLDLTGVAVRAVTLAGRPGQEIARYAEDTQADILGVVVPTRSLGFMDRLLSHPVILLLDKLPCSVLLYRSPHEDRD